MKSWMTNPRRGLRAATRLRLNDLDLWASILTVVVSLGSAQTPALASDPSRLNEVDGAVYAELQRQGLAAFTGDTEYAVLEIGTKWCGYCKQLKGSLGALAASPGNAARQGNVRFYSIDMEKYPEIRRLVQFSGGVPVTILIRNGEWMKGHGFRGAISTNQVASWIDDNISKLGTTRAGAQANGGQVPKGGANPRPPAPGGGADSGDGSGRPAPQEPGDPGAGAPQARGPKVGAPAGPGAGVGSALRAPANTDPIKVKPDPEGGGGYHGRAGEITEIQSAAPLKALGKAALSADSQYTILELGTESCDGCIKLREKLLAMASKAPWKDRLRFFSVDVEKLEEFQNLVDLSGGVPVTLILKDGKIVGRMDGPKSTEELETWASGLVPPSGASAGQQAGPDGGAGGPPGKGAGSGEGGETDPSGKLRVGDVLVGTDGMVYKISSFRDGKPFGYRLGKPSRPYPPGTFLQRGAEVPGESGGGSAPPAPQAPDSPSPPAPDPAPEQSTGPMPDFPTRIPGGPVNTQGLNQCTQPRPFQNGVRPFPQPLAGEFGFVNDGARYGQMITTSFVQVCQLESTLKLGPAKVQPKFADGTHSDGSSPGGHPPGAHAHGMNLDFTYPLKQMGHGLWAGPNNGRRLVGYPSDLDVERSAYIFACLANLNRELSNTPQGRVPPFTTLAVDIQVRDAMIPVWKKMPGLDANYVASSMRSSNSFDGGWGEFHGNHSHIRMNYGAMNNTALKKFWVDKLEQRIAQLASKKLCPQQSSPAPDASSSADEEGENGTGTDASSGK